LKYTLTGKPSALAFECAKETLKGINEQRNDLQFYMVGDYPLIDIKGGK